MVKTQMALGGGGTKRYLKSPKSQKTPKQAFSIAEAMITFLIVSITLATAAPMISKQVKINAMSDTQARIFNDKIIELQRTKWFSTPDNNSITRPNGNVGIGISADTNPSAKLDVAGNLKVSIADTGSISNCSYGETDCPISAKIGNVNRFAIRNTGGLFLKPKADETKLAIYDDEGKVQLAFYGNNFFGLQNRKRGIGTSAEQEVYAFNINEHGQVFLNPPTRDEVRTEPDKFTRNDAYAFAIRYPEDSDPKYDCGGPDDENGECTPTTNDGFTDTAVFTSNGTLYINSITTADSHAAFVVRNGTVPRMIVRKNGSILLRPTDELNSNALVLMKPLGTKKSNGAYDTNVYAHIKTDGSAYFAGNLTVDGMINNAGLNAKLSKMDNQLNNAEKVIVELRAENAQLKNKLAMFETQLAQVLAQQELDKITIKRTGKFLK